MRFRAPIAALAAGSVLLRGESAEACRSSIHVGWIDNPPNMKRMSQLWEFIIPESPRDPSTFSDTVIGDIFVCAWRAQVPSEKVCGSLGLERKWSEFATCWRTRWPSEPQFHPEVDRFGRRRSHFKKHHGTSRELEQSCCRRPHHSICLYTFVWDVPRTDSLRLRLSDAT